MLKKMRSGKNHPGELPATRGAGRADRKWAEQINTVRLWKKWVTMSWRAVSQSLKF